MPKGRILIVDDEPVIAESLSELLEGWGYETAVASDGLLGLAKVEEFRPSVVVSDVYMPNLDGFGLLRELRELHPETAVILLTGQGTVEMALRAIQDEGAFHYLEKPIDFAKLRLVVERAAEYAEARRENLALRLQLRDRGAFGELVGASEPMRQIYALIEQVAPSSASVLLTGESGTGKELCAHERGAFTGAAARRLGCFELANGGTLLLDEISEMPVSLQAKLLRVLEDRKIRRLGGSAELSVDVRVLAATNRDPEEAVRRGTFREDLLYRLNVITVELPPLRKRKEDIPLLAQHLVAQLAERHARPAKLLSPAAVEALQSHSWPGNVRELRNVIERAVIICSSEVIERHHLAPYPLEQRAQSRGEDTLTLPVGTPIEEVERRMILRTLQKTENNKTRAAELLQISLKTLHNKLRLYREQGRLPQPEEAGHHASLGDTEDALSAGGRGD